MSLLALFMCLAEVAIMDSVNGLLGVGMYICLCKLFYFFCFSVVRLDMSSLVHGVLIGPHWSMVMSCHLIGSCMPIMDHG